MSSNLLYVGLRGQVVAIDKDTGATRWQTKLKGGLTSGERFVSLLVADGRVYAHTYGELFCLDQETGSMLWRNGLDGLGYDIATLATEGIPSSSLAALASLRKRQSADAGTAYPASGGGR
jgi:outer membrane protein assembly factor BamB